MDGELAITVRRERGVVIAAVTGDIDISTVTRLRALVRAGGRRGTLIVDLNQVTFIDSAGLGALDPRRPEGQRPQGTIVRPSGVVQPGPA